LQLALWDLDKDISLLRYDPKLYQLGSWTLLPVQERNSLLFLGLAWLTKKIQNNNAFVLDTSNWKCLFNLETWWCQSRLPDFFSFLQILDKHTSHVQLKKVGVVYIEAWVDYNIGAKNSCW